MHRAIECEEDMCEKKRQTEGSRMTESDRAREGKRRRERERGVGEIMTDRLNRAGTVLNNC